MKLPVALTAAIAAALLAPAAAGAATASVTGGAVPTLRVIAPAGERNVVTLAPAGEGEVLVRDAGAPLTAGAGCRAVGPDSAVCAGRRFVSVSLDDGDDALTATVAPVRVEGGEGSDALTGIGGTLEGQGGNDTLVATAAASRGTLSGGSGDDVLTGGAGDEYLDGGGGRDRLAGGPGADTLFDGDGPGFGRPVIDPPPADGDEVDGGDGVDTVSYSSRRGVVTVDLRREDGQGERGEGDVLRGVEGVAGGRAADVLTGTDGPNRIIADGIDRVSALGGDDVVSGAGGTGSGGRIDLGAGDDRVFGGELGRGRPLIVCGPGTDRVDRAQGVRRAPADCEVLGYAAAHLLVDPQPVVRGGTVRGPRLGCGALRRTPRTRCRARLRLSLGAEPGGTRIGSSPTVAAPVDGTAALPVRLGPYARRLLARRGTLTVRMTLERETEQGRRYALGTLVATLRR